MAGKSGAPWWAHMMLYAGGMTMVVAGGAAAVTQIGLNTANGAVEQEDILGDAQADMDVENISGPLNILVLGVDKQGGSTRSDTMIMVHINEDLTQASMVSLPRDLYVEIPDCGPDWGNNTCMQKLNHAASISDDWDVTRANVVSTIYNLTGVEFHMGATVDFNGFMDLVDLVGEIELCPWHEITSIHGDKKTFPEGCNYYGKEDALDLIRQRYPWDEPEDYENDLWGDYGRQAMQQQAIKALIKELKADGYHKDPGKLSDVLEGLEGKLTHGHAGRPDHDRPGDEPARPRPRGHHVDPGARHVAGDGGGLFGGHRRGRAAGRGRRIVGRAPERHDGAVDRPRTPNGSSRPATPGRRPTRAATLRRAPPTDPAGHATRRRYRGVIASGRRRPELGVAWLAKAGRPGGPT